MPVWLRVFCAMMILVFGLPWLIKYYGDYLEWVINRNKWGR